LRDAVREEAAARGRQGRVTTAKIWISVNPVRINVQSIGIEPASDH
jgi:hypothetical protein